MDGANIPQNFLFLTYFLLVVVCILLYLGIRFYASSRRKSITGEQKPDGRQPVEFVVDTFKELVAKLKEKERELEELRSRAEYRADTYESYNENILQSVPSGVITFDVEGRIVTVNRAAAEILHIQADELIGESAVTLGPAIAAILKNPESAPSERKEATFETRDGHKLWLGFFTSILKGRDGRKLGIILGFTDLTEVRLLREKIELRERLTHLGEVSAGIAHELRNPMAVIAGYVQMLDAKTPDNAPGKQAMQAIQKEISGMNRVITDFLQFARPTELNSTSLDLAEIIPDLLRATLAEESVIKVELELTADVPVRGDEVLLRQALVNLIRNAVEVMPKGGTVTITSVLKGEGVLELKIQDTGTGIPETIRDKIFIPFVTEKAEGTGLGLAIVHKIIVLHEGTIEVQSGDQGTTFTIRIPVAEKVSSIS